MNFNRVAVQLAWIKRLSSFNDNFTLSNSTFLTVFFYQLWIRLGLIIAKSARRYLTAEARIDFFKRFGSNNFYYGI